jgi:hypothetical protein
MLEGLDSIPWAKLTHAYGSAEDVPGLLRALQTASPDAQNDESPLWCLFGNIWHQGTVYEATAYAVPFLIELAADRNTPDRTGILHLVASIATGSSYLEVHGNVLPEPEFEANKAKELRWAAAAHEAVAAGLNSLIALTNEQGDVQVAAAHVLAQFPERSKEVAPLLRQLLEAETRSLYRAGFLLLLGKLGDRSEATLERLTGALTLDAQLQRLAAAVSLAKLKPQPMTDAVRQAISDALITDDLGETFVGLPWDVSGEIDPGELRQSLDEESRNVVAESLIAEIESGGATNSKVVTLIDILFPADFRRRVKNVEKVTAAGLSPLQRRAVRALATKVVEAEKRIFCGHFPQWGLPDTKREWRELAAGREFTPVDMTLPILAYLADPRRAVVASRLVAGQRVVHRSFGMGTVTKVSPSNRGATVVVDFDVEGTMTLGL